MIICPNTSLNVLAQALLVEPRLATVEVTFPEGLTAHDIADLLEENGLIDILFDEGRPCLTFSQLPDVERYSRMYYDLSINMEGIDVIHHLLERMDEMQREIRDLRTRLRMFE